jgi:hypothetical protein
MKKTIIGGLVAGGVMLGAAWRVLRVGIAKADTGLFSGPEGDRDASALWTDIEPGTREGGGIERTRQAAA